MDLINLLPHKRNTTVTVNGTNYPIDGDGLCKGVKQDDAGKMLQNVEAWRQWDGKAPVRTAPASRLGLIGAGGEVVKPDATKIDPDAAMRAAQDQFEAEKSGDANPPPSARDEFVVPEDGDWPDPIDAMPIEYLRQMAEAYEVKFAKVNKKDLIKKITAKMYPDGK